MKKCSGVFSLFLLLAGRWGTLAAQKEPVLEPKLQDVTLSVGGRSIGITSSRASWSYARRIGSLEIAIGRDGAVAKDVTTRAVTWEASFKAEGPMRWLANNELTIFLAPVKPIDVVSRVWRLEVSSGHWLDALLSSEEQPKEMTADVTGAAVLADGGLFTLVLTVVKNRSSHEDGTLLSYRVSRFAPGRAKPEWSRTFPSAGKRGRPGAYLLSSQRPDYAVDSPTPLTLLGDELIVCAGPKEELISLKQASGADSWSLPRLWEYRRGFIGPSVWAHFLGRYGLDQFDLELAEKEVGKVQGTNEQYHKAVKERVNQAKARAEKEDGFIVAGPLVLAGAKPEQASLFVVTGKSDDVSWGGYLAEAILYELTESGVPIATSPLPRMVNPSQHFSDTRAVLWGCPRGALLRVARSPHRSGFGGDLGTSDMLCQIDWYRNPEVREPAAWLSADPAGDPIAWTHDHGFRPLAGGYVEKKGDHVYHFPIGKIDVGTGLVETLTLKVPFQGDVPPPSTNYWGTADELHAHGPYLLGVTGLSVTGDALEIVIGARDKASSVRFALAELGTK